MATQIGQSLRAVTDAAIGPIAPHVAARLADLTQHDPVTLQAMVEALPRPQRSGMAMMSDPPAVPSSVADAIVKRIDALSSAGRRLITVAALSVLDRADVMLAATAVDVGTLMNEDIADILVFSEGRFRFLDQLVRAVLRQGLPPEERESAHRSLARATSERDLSLVATWHAAQSRPRAARSAAALLALAETLLTRGDVHGAWTVAMATRGDRDTAGRSRFIAGRAAFASGCFDDAETLLDQAAHFGPPAQRSAAATARDAAIALRDIRETVGDPSRQLADRLERIASATVTATDAKAMEKSRAIVRERPYDPEEADARQARLHLAVMKARPPWPWDLVRGPLSPLIEAFVLGQYTELQLRSGDAAGAAMTLRDAARRLPMTHVGAAGHLALSASDVDASFSGVLAMPVSKQTIRPASPLDDSWGNPPLSRRQRQIAKLILEGMSNREIAEELDISPRTVEVHTSGVFRKVGVRTRGQLVARLFRTGIGENP